MVLQPTRALLTEPDRERLNQILQEPLLTAAINIAIREAQPDTTSLAKLTPAQQASIANQMAGMSELVRRLSNLSSPINTVGPPPDPTSEVGEWEGIEPEEDRQPS